MEYLLLAALIITAFFVARHLAQTPYTIPTVHLAFSEPLPRHTTQGALHRAYLSATVKSATKGFWGLQPSTVAGLQVQHINHPKLNAFLARSFPPEIHAHEIELASSLVVINSDLRYELRPTFEFTTGDLCTGVSLSLLPVGAPSFAVVH